MATQVLLAQAVAVHIISALGAQPLPEARAQADAVGRRLDAVVRQV